MSRRAVQNGARHVFDCTVVWQGDRDSGTDDYDLYSRDYRVETASKPDILGSAAPAFRGTAERLNPEDLFVSAVSACHMLVYLALCARRGIRVLAYRDRASGTLALDSRGGRFSKVRLRPAVMLAPGSDVRTARRLHDTAHGNCFIANSCSMPIIVEPTFEEES